MRKFYLTKLLLSTTVLVASGIFSFAQCPVGSSTATVNWDNLDYLTQSGNYAAFVSTAMMQTQKFTMGVNRLSINFPATFTTAGETTINTAEAGSYGTGADVEYNGLGAITITFDAAVNNLQFSLYDIDSSQSVRISATDAASAALNINMTAVTAGVLTITGSGTTAPSAGANATAVLNNDTRGTLNVSIAGNSPAGTGGVKKVIINIGGTSGKFWLSDLTACVLGSFPLNYFISQKPWQGQPGYYLVTPDNNSVYLLNPLTGVAQWMFTEPASPWVNSIAYDPNNHILYYVMDHSSPVSTNKSLKKYDFNTETISTIIPDLTTLGIPLFDIVVESAGAAFYNGSLFLGIEGTNSTKTSGRKSIIWRIDFDALQNPVQAAQVFAQTTDDGKGLLMHDWGDFTIKDGVLFDFNTGNSGTTSQFIHFNMQSGNTTIYATNGNPAPIQAGQTWDGTIYWTGGQGSETGRVAKYNENGTIGTKIIATVSACSPAWVGRAGDASDPFRPKSDFGDAPDSYDPVADDKATHEYDCNLRLGATFDREWDKTSSANATADGSDEDGITTVTILTRGVVNYAQDVQVYNNTGANATLIGWIDYNGNGVFDPTEGKALTIPSSASTQTVTLAWLGIPVTLAVGTTTFMRIRLTSSTNGMTVNNPTHWFANGEVEDYPVHVDNVLPIKLFSFTAAPDGNNKVLLTWASGKEENLRGYEIEQSADGANWHSVSFVAAYSNEQSLNNYHGYDNNPSAGKSYYRLMFEYTDGHTEYSDTRVVEWRSKDVWMKLSPNPVHDHAVLQFSLDRAENVTIYLVGANGLRLMQKTMAASKGYNQLGLNDWKGITPGVYIIQVLTSSDVLSTKLIVE
ncbi:MAG: GEVED domain-containing protein [Flavisolibacter sp.]